MKTAPVIVKLKHDTGTIKVKTWATSIEAAKQMVLKAQNAPDSAILYARAARPTIADVKAATAESAPYFFDRKTMRFWGQKMSDFSITRHGDDKFLIEAPRPHGVTRRIFDPFAGTIELFEQ